MLPRPLERAVYGHFPLSVVVVAPLEHTGREYHTDEGVIVPCISVQLRNKLIKTSGEYIYSTSSES